MRAILVILQCKMISKNCGLTLFQSISQIYRKHIFVLQELTFNIHLPDLCSGKTYFTHTFVQVQKFQQIVCGVMCK